MRDLFSSTNHSSLDDSQVDDKESLSVNKDVASTGLSMRRGSKYFATPTPKRQTLQSVSEDLESSDLMGADENDSPRDRDAIRRKAVLISSEIDLAEQ